MTDLVPGEFADALLAIAEERGDGLVPIPQDLLPAKGVLPDGERDAYIDRLVAQSIASLTEPVKLSGALDHLTRAYVHCTGYHDSVMGPFVERGKAEGWSIRELDTEHDLHLFDPEGTASVIHGLATLVD